MDVLSLLREYLMNWVIEPVTGQFLGIFDFNGRLGLSVLCMSYSVAYGLTLRVDYHAVCGRRSPTLSRKVGETTA
ncbi:hypothetical protein [Pseudomonas sp. NFX15]|uniref:hypothetical protein n=1 Tax=Pseudomonas sp. NFX15 TaxID=2816958 RepID=UPI003B9E6540